jgi:hypothetical protein
MIDWRLEGLKQGLCRERTAQLCRHIGSPNCLAMQTGSIWRRVSLCVEGAVPYFRLLYAHDALLWYDTLRLRGEDPPFAIRPCFARHAFLRDTVMQNAAKTESTVNNVASMVWGRRRRPRCRRTFPEMGFKSRALVAEKKGTRSGA